MSTYPNDVIYGGSSWNGFATSATPMPAPDANIELDSHAVILAKGAWSETFIDDDSRMMFHNADDYFRRYPGESDGLPVY